MQKVVLVEDDQTMVSLLTTLLTLEGYAVRASGNSHLASLIDLIKTERPEAALVDVNLRTANGIDLVRQIRQEPELDEMVILMSSGLNLQDECLEAGADGFLLKPFMPDALIALIRSNIEAKNNIHMKEKR